MLLYFAAAISPDRKGGFWLLLRPLQELQALAREQLAEDLHMLVSGSQSAEDQFTAYGSKESGCCACFAFGKKETYTVHMWVDPLRAKPVGRPSASYPTRPFVFQSEPAPWACDAAKAHSSKQLRLTMLSGWELEPLGIFSSALQDGKLGPLGSRVSGPPKQNKTDSESLRVPDGLY